MNESFDQSINQSINLNKSMNVNCTCTEMRKLNDMHACMHGDRHTAQVCDLICECPSEEGKRSVSDSEGEGGGGGVNGRAVRLEHPVLVEVNNRKVLPRACVCMDRGIDEGVRGREGMKEGRMKEGRMNERKM